MAAFREALKERTRERVPLAWAATQGNLGRTLASLGERESGTERLTQAVAAYQEALKEFTEERSPYNHNILARRLEQTKQLIGKRSLAGKGATVSSDDRARKPPGRSVCCALRFPQSTCLRIC